MHKALCRSLPVLNQNALDKALEKICIYKNHHLARIIIYVTLLNAKF